MPSDETCYANMVFMKGKVVNLLPALTIKNLDKFSKFIRTLLKMSNLLSVKDIFG